MCTSTKPGATSLPLASISSLPFADDLADLGDAAVLDGDVRLVELAALAVGNGTAANDEIGHGVISLVLVADMMDRRTAINERPHLLPPRKGEGRVGVTTLE